jgi:hypothetical protein
MNLFANQQWLLIALVFFGVIGYVVWIRWRDRLWIERHYGLDTARIMSFGVNYFGTRSRPATRRPSSGFLLLLPDRLVYRSRLAKQLMEIPGDRITQVTHGNTLGSAELHQSVVKIAFDDPDKGVEVAAFKVPYPPQWIAAIKASFLPSEKTPDGGDTR